MKRKEGTATLLAASTLVLSLTISTPALATSSYGTQQWYLNYMQQYSSGRLGPAQPTPAQPPAPTDPDVTPPGEPAEPAAPAQPSNPPAGEPAQPGNPPADLPSQPSNPPATSPTAPVYSSPTAGQSVNDWYLNYLRQYQYTRPYVPAPSQPGTSNPSDPAPNAPVDRPSQPSYDVPTYLTPEEQELLHYINEERAANGVGVVTVDPELVRVARLRAEKLVELGGIQHDIPGYSTAGKQLTREGYKYAYLGEDLAAAGSVYQAHKQLVKSSPHREIMLEPRFTKVGIAVAHWKNRPGVVVVEIFVQPQ